MDYSKHVSGKQTPQSKPLPGRLDMAKNDAEGWGWEVDPWSKLRRFLVIGTDGGSYYVGEAKLTNDHASNLYACMNLDAKATVDMIVEVSDQGLGKSNETCVFALAVAFSHAEAKTFAADAFPRVIRIGTHLFRFLHYVKHFRGFGRGLRRVLADWYLTRSPEQVAYQMVKYFQRDGWSHRDVLRLAHPKAKAGSMIACFNYACGRPNDEEPALIAEVRRLKAPDLSIAHICQEIRTLRIPREALPTELLQQKPVWDALLADMPMTAMIRNLAKMTAVGLLAPHAQATDLVVERLNDTERLKRARVHPLVLLSAQRVYASGKGFLGSLEWMPVAEIVDALDTAFEHSIGYVEPAVKRLLVAVDVSASMSQPVNGLRGISCAEAAGALALVYARSEPHVEVVGFTAGTYDNYGIPTSEFARKLQRQRRDGLTSLHITKKTRLDDALRNVRSHNFGGTDVALPMRYAVQNQRKVDGFVILTDGETWAGDQHPSQALQEYRDKTGIPARYVQLAMTSNNYTTADPTDANAMDVVGLDASALGVVREFLAG